MFRWMEETCPIAWTCRAVLQRKSAPRRMGSDFPDGSRMVPPTGITQQQSFVACCLFSRTKPYLWGSSGVPRRRREYAGVI